MVAASSLGFRRCRIDIAQAAAGRRLSFRLDPNVGITPENGRAWARKFASNGAERLNPLRSRMPAPRPARIAGIYRYPVKGLSPEPLGRADLRPGETLKADRRYAIENGPSGFDPTAPKWLPKPNFLMLMRDEWLAGLRTRFDDASNVLSINHDGRIVAQGNLAAPEGRQAIENFFATAFAGRIKGPPRVLTSPGHSFSDVARKVVSVINLASVRAVENMVGAPVDPLRFRANIHVEGWPAWHEFDLVGRTLAIGDVRLKVVKRIVRCAAVNVDPDTAARDLAIPQALMRRLGHADCGIYAEVVAGGSVGAGDTIAADQAELL
jgi:uncharacterized protein